MSLLNLVPDLVEAASGNLQNIGSALHSANAAAAAQTSAIAAPAADEVSAAITALFGAHAQEFQTLNAQAAAFHDEFVNLLNGGAARYVHTEMANAGQTLLNSIGTGQSIAGAAAANPAASGFWQNVEQDASSLYGKVSDLVGGFASGQVGKWIYNGATTLASQITGLPVSEKIGVLFVAGVGTFFGPEGTVGGAELAIELEANAAIFETSIEEWTLSAYSGAFQLPTLAELAGIFGPGIVAGQVFNYVTGAGDLVGSYIDEFPGVFAGVVQTQVVNPLLGVINESTDAVFGRPLIGPDGLLVNTGSPPTTTPTTTNVSIPLTVVDTPYGNFPTVMISVNGHTPVPVLVDTGSTGLVIASQDIGGLSSLTPVGTGTTTYLAGSYNLNVYNGVTVNYGNGVTAPEQIFGATTVVGQSATFLSAVSQYGFQGILGIGSNSGGPAGPMSSGGTGTGSPVLTLPGTLNQGVLVDEPGGQLTFGSNPLPALSSVPGVDAATQQLYLYTDSAGYDVSEALSTQVYFDSGGGYGTIPQSVLAGYPPIGSQLPVETTIQVGNSAILYGWATTAADPGPVVVAPGGQFNTGNEPFAESPIYISTSPSGVGTMYFDY